MVDDGVNGNEQTKNDEETPGVDDKTPGVDKEEDIPGVDDLNEPQEWTMRPLRMKMNQTRLRSRTKVQNTRLVE